MSFFVRWSHKRKTLSYDRILLNESFQHSTMTKLWRDLSSSFSSINVLPVRRVSLSRITDESTWEEFFLHHRSKVIFKNRFEIIDETSGKFLFCWKRQKPVIQHQMFFFILLLILLPFEEQLETLATCHQHNRLISHKNIVTFGYLSDEKFLLLAKTVHGQRDFIFHFANRCWETSSSKSWRNSAVRLSLITTPLTSIDK